MLYIGPFRFRFVPDGDDFGVGRLLVTTVYDSASLQTTRTEWEAFKSEIREGVIHMGEDVQASAHPLNDEQERTLQDPQVEVTHPDALARKQAQADKVDPDTLIGSGNNPTAEQGGVGEKTGDMDLDPSQSGASKTDDEEDK